jgi:HK97 gp10 family phage protein
VIRVKFEGGAELASALGELSNRVSRSVLRAALVEAGEPIRGTAAAIAPREPGAPDLADNIVMSNARPEDGSVGIAIGPSTDFFYGSFQEFGTSRHGAQPFLRPAFDSGWKAALGVVRGALWRALIRRGLAGTRGSSSGGGLD